MTPDDIDRQLLAHLQTDARAGLRTLADATGLSVTSAQRRIARMRSEGVIQGEVAVIDPKALDHPMTFVVQVEMERERAHDIDAFARRCQAETRVQQCYYVTGEADFILICLTRDMEDFEDLSRHLFFDNTNVRRFRTSVAMGRRKVTLSVPTG
ncbi:MAG: Lrp/AsnC family transcriptional regulator [Pseudomonadota bacterium]